MVEALNGLRTEYLWQKKNTFAFFICWHWKATCVCNYSSWNTRTRLSYSHYNDVIMGAITSQITSLTIVYSTVYSGADQRKYQSSALLAFVRGIHRGQVNSPHKWTVTRKTFPFDDVIMSQYHDAYWLSSPRTFWLQHQTISFLDNVLQFEICDIAAIVGIGKHGICLILQEWSSVSNGGVKEPVPKIYLKKFDIEFPNPRFSHPSWP